ncbi:hypothetical protein D9758_006140 [Tetrapyrgos nigripes]|uniref:Nucleotide-diphospho-sugar transferase n=1 Tax=Tetrapyrgos nigripes TaxID=182062 RepID=A0A8H5GAT7_9AGAR|nr:hypothetical protein D9758_006140 [Tetrapyrgos nigripes]
MAFSDFSLFRTLKFSYESYELLPSNANPSNLRNPNRRRFILLAIVFLTYTLVVCGLTSFLTQKRLEVHSYLDNYQYLNTVPIVRNESTWSSMSSSEHAVFTVLYSDSYALASAVLGNSIRHANVSASMILPYIPDQLSPKALCIVEAVGWQTHPVSLVPPPHNGEGIAHRFKDQYTKLTIWSLGEQLGIDSAVYLDGDTLVLRNFDELFNFPWEFGAAQDVFPPHDPRAFSNTYNAGVLAFRPSQATFEDMLVKLEMAKYPLEYAEQAFLNLYFGGKGVRLPYAYNGNMVVKERSAELWAELRDDMRVLHYTALKPFWNPKTPDGQLLTPEEMEQYIEAAEEMKGGTYRDEVRLYLDAFHRTMEDSGPAIRACYDKS